MQRNIHNIFNITLNYAEYLSNIESITTLQYDLLDRIKMKKLFIEYDDLSSITIKNKFSFTRVLKWIKKQK